MACSNSDCPRCVVAVPRLCCDTCNPDSFILPPTTTSAPKQTRAPNRIKVGEYGMSSVDRRLKTALEEWRSTQLEGTIGDDEMFGPQLIMTDDVLERLVGLARSGKVSDLSSIQTQVNWRYIDLWGTEILDIIKSYFPVIEPSPVLQALDNMPGPSTANRPTIAPSDAPSIQPGSRDPKPRTRRCSACGSAGHIGTSYQMNSITDVYNRFTASNRICPNHRTRTGAVQNTNENVFLVSELPSPLPRSHSSLLQQVAQFS